MPAKWNAREILAPTGACAFTLNVFAEGFSVGDPPQLGDDSLDTFAYIKGRWGDAVANDLAQVHVEVASKPDGVDATDNVRLAVWHKSASPTRAPTVRLSLTPGANYVANSAGSPGDLPTAAGWTVEEMLPIESMAQLLAGWTHKPLVIEFATDFSEPEPSGTAFQEHTIYEARLAVYYRVSATAPPCRVYPADMLGSVGGPVRQYPPSKSRQRSSRGVGYY